MQNRALVLDFLEWIADRPRPYAEVMDTWRTSCPRLTIWEDAVDANLVRRSWDATSGSTVTISTQGAIFLHAERPRLRAGAAITSA